MRRRQIQPATFHLAKMRDEFRGVGAIPSDKRREIAQQNGIGEMGKCVRLHGSSANGNDASGRGGDEHA